jgi:sec-independent protein translocase protein TatA
VIHQAVILFISGGEIGFILLIVVMVFGADKIPDIARGLGRGIKQVKNATNDIKYEITKGVENQVENTDVTKDITNQINQVKDELEEFTGSIKRKM